MRAETSKSRLSHRCDRPCHSHCFPPPPPSTRELCTGFRQLYLPRRSGLLNRLWEPRAHQHTAFCGGSHAPTTVALLFLGGQELRWIHPCHSSFKGQASCSFGKGRFASVCLLFSLKKDPGAGRRGYTVSLQRTSRGGVTRMVALVMRAEDFARRRSRLGLGFCLSNDHRLSGLDGASIDLL